MGIVDGLGGEEVNQDVNVQTAIVSGTNVYGATSVSGASIRGGQLSTPGSVSDPLGRVRNTVISHAGSTYGGFVQAGSVTMTAGSVGFIALANNFANASYLVSMTPQSVAAGAGSTVPMVSGAKNVSGVNVEGTPSVVYDYIAVGV